MIRLKEELPPLLHVSSAVEDALASEINDLTESLYDAILDLREQLSAVKTVKPVAEQAAAYRKQVVPAMERLRTVADALETLIPQDRWPFPCYSEILYNI